jgi:hypothetical protein
MINFIKWGLSHENDAISLFFAIAVMVIVFGWFLGMMTALFEMNFEAILVLLLPIIYAFIELYKLYRQERDECDK